MAEVFKIYVLILSNLFSSIAYPLPGFLVVFGDSFSDNGVNLLEDDNDGFRRYSTGPVWPEYLAKLLSLNLMDHAYSGAKSGLGNYNFPQPWSGVLWQVQQYIQTRKNDEIPSNNLIIFQAGGSNDLAAREFNATQILGNNAAALKLLIDQKAPRIIVLNVPDLTLL